MGSAWQVELARAIGDKDMEAYALRVVAEDGLDSPGVSLKAAQDSQALCKSLGDRLGEAEALEAIWKAHLATGQPAAALQAATDAVTVFQELGRRGGEAMACIMTASAQLACKATAAAVNAARGGVLLFHAVGDTLGEASALLSLVKALLQKASEGTFVQDGVGVHRWESSGSCLSFAFCQK